MSTRNIKTLHVRIYGKVQGVFFRDHTRRTAETLDISGWVKNLSDGSVEALISGEDEQIDKMLHWFNRGSPSSVVQKVVVDEGAPPSGNNRFLIQR